MNRCPWEIVRRFWIWTAPGITAIALWSCAAQVTPTGAASTPPSREPASPPTADDPTTQWLALRAEIAAIDPGELRDHAQCERWALALVDLHERNGFPYVEARLEAAELWRSCNEPQRARVVLDAAVQDMPRWARARAANTLGVLAHERGAQGDAIAHFYAALRDDPALHEARSNLVRVLLRIHAGGGSSMAREHAGEQIDRWLELAPERPGPRLARARLVLIEARQEQDEAAREQLLREAALLWTPLLQQPHPDATRARAAMLLAEGRLIADEEVGALRAMTWAVELDPHLASARLARGRLLLHMRNFDLAREQFEIVRDDIEPVEERDRLRGLAIAYRGLRRYEDAEKIYRRLLRAPAPDPVDLYNRAHLELAMATHGEVDREGLVRARERFSAVVEMTQDNPQQAEVHARARAERDALDARLSGGTNPPSP